MEVGKFDGLQLYSKVLYSNLQLANFPTYRRFHFVFLPHQISAGTLIRDQRRAVLVAFRQANQRQLEIQFELMPTEARLKR